MRVTLFTNALIFSPPPGGGGIPVLDRHERRASVGTALVGGTVMVVALLGRESGAAPHLAVPPNQDFSNSTLQIHAPPSSGWYGVSQTANRIVFEKAGVNADETFVAAVFLFRLPALLDEDTLTEYVREGAIKDSPSDRFDTLEQTVRYSSERSYRCVRYHGIGIDKKAQVGFFRKRMRIENIALYCEHPDKPGLGFSVSYSHRGGRPDYELDEEAAAFIESVQVAAPGKAP
jgi:hypothetical protein